MPFPVNKTGLHIAHSVHHELHQATIADAVPFPDLVINKEVTNLSLAVAARRANVLRRVRIETIAKRVNDLLQLLSASNLPAPVAEVIRAHDGEAASAAAAVVLNPVRRHFAESRRDLAKNLSLRFNHSHQTHE